MKASAEVCCLEFNPAPWEETYHTFKEKKFIKGEVKSFLHMPINMGQVITDMMAKIEAADAKATGEDFVMMSYDLSPWKSELYIAATKFISNVENVRLSGNFMSKVFDGPFKQVPKWIKEMNAYVKSQGHDVKKLYFYYTTCPKCAKKYGHNYIVAIAEV